MNTYPKEAGAGGIIFHPGGNIVSSYAWGLSQKTNNEVQCLALFFGMNLARELNISKITILGNSKQVIYKMNNGYNKGVVKIKRIYKCIHQVPAKYQVSYLHVLQGNNSKVDKLANQGAKLKIGSTQVKGNSNNFFYVP